MLDPPTTREPPPEAGAFAGQSGQEDSDVKMVDAAGEVEPPILTPPVLAYMRPSRRDEKSVFSGWTGALIAAFAEHLWVFYWYASVLDGGYLARTCAIASLAYWLGVLFLYLRRRSRTLTPGDLVYVAFGYPIILIPTVLAWHGRL